MGINTVKCGHCTCNGRVFDIAPKCAMRRVLVFVDECPIWLKSRAVIKSIGFNGIVKEVLSRNGAKAEKLLKKYNLKDAGDHKVEKGSRQNVYWKYLDGPSGWIKDLNGRKIEKVK